jgi:hypothetical protein
MADPEQLKILKQGVDAWNRYVQAGDKIDLSWADLRRAELWGANLGLAGLRGADLRGAKLQGSELEGANCRTVINEAG